MQTIFAAFQTLPGFALYLLSATLLTIAFIALYIRTTPHRELALIRAGNTTAAIKLSGALIGFTLPVASVIHHSLDLLDMTLWGLVALLVQITGYQLVRLMIPNLSAEVEADKMGVGILAAAVAIALGILNAACMSY